MEVHPTIRLPLRRSMGKTRAILKTNSLLSEWLSNVDRRNISLVPNSSRRNPEQQASNLRPRQWLVLSTDHA